MTSSEIQDSWRRYKECEDPGARDRLIRHFSYLVKITAGRVISNLPPSMERDDLVSAGALGLIKAVDQFDTKRQVKFETYAIALIRGAILEMLREDDWVPRSIREKVKMLDRLLLDMEIRLGRPATRQEMADELHITLEEYERMLVDTSRTSVQSLEDVLVGGDSSEKISLADMLHDESAVPAAEVEMHERKRMLGKAIDRLPQRERLVVSLYYFEGLTFKEIGRVLEISESRVYQLHTQAVLRLHGYLQVDTELFR